MVIRAGKERNGPRETGLWIRLYGNGPMDTAHGIRLEIAIGAGPPILPGRVRMRAILT